MRGRPQHPPLPPAPAYSFEALQVDGETRKRVIQADTAQLGPPRCCAARRWCRWRWCQWRAQATRCCRVQLPTTMLSAPCSAKTSGNQRSGASGMPSRVTRAPCPNSRSRLPRMARFHLPPSGPRARINSGFLRASRARQPHALAPRCLCAHFTMAWWADRVLADERPFNESTYVFRHDTIKW